MSTPIENNTAALQALLEKANALPDAGPGGGSSSGGGGGGGVQPDWNQNDDTQPDYVKNKTHYKEAVVIIEEQTFTPVADGAPLTAVAMPSIGQPITVVFDGEAYQCVTVDLEGPVGTGNFALFLTGAEDTGEPFFVGVMEQDGVVMAMCMCADNTTDHTIKVDGDAYHKLPTTYYDQAHKLYIDPDTRVYLTHDVYGETKVTKEELLSIANRESIVLSLGGMQYFAPIAVLSVASIAYGRVAYYDGRDFASLYTAEYTPTT